MGEERSFERIFKLLASDHDNECMMIDATIVRAPSTAPAHENNGAQAIGRSRGGLTTEIHALVDALGNPVEVMLTPGDASRGAPSAAAWVGGIGLAVFALRFENAGAGARCAAVSAIGAIAIAAALMLEPRCLGGPFATLDPAVWPIWHSHVREIQSLVAISRQQWVVGAAIAAYPLAALVAAAALARDADVRRDPAFAIIVVALVLATAMTVAAIRTAPYAMWLCIPVIAAAALRLNTWFNFKSLASRVAVMILLAPAVVSAGAIVIADAAGAPPVAGRATRPVSNLPATVSCITSQGYRRSRCRLLVLRACFDAA